MTSSGLPALLFLLVGLAAPRIQGQGLQAQEGAPEGASSEETPKLAGSDVPVPKRTKTIPPEYPAEASAQGLRGIVILELVVDTEGRVASARVVRSVPPFDEAALAAARRWEYEPTRVDGKPVSVRLTVPISFAIKLPVMTREEGIPELRQGVNPPFPRKGKRARVIAEVTLEADGRVAEAQIETGESPWSDALLLALRTWRFAVDGGEGGVITFRVHADFIPGPPAHIDLQLRDLERAPAPATPMQAAQGSSPAPDATTSAETAPAPEPTPSVSPEPPPSPPAAVPIPGPPTAASPSPVPRQPPPIEVITAPPPRTADDQPSVSAVHDVTLSPGVPHLVKGRRPVVPPLARMGGVEGTVEVRFAVDAAGVASVRATEGPELLKTAAEQTVASWLFRRTTPGRLHLVAELTYRGDIAAAVVRPAPE